MKKAWLLILVLLLQLCVTLGFGAVVSYGKTRDQAPAGLFIWGHDISHLSREQVSAQIREKIPDAITYEEEVYPLKWERTNAAIEQWLDLVYPPATGSLISDVLQNLTRPLNVLRMGDLSLNKEEGISQLQEFSQRINQPARIATIEFVDGQLKRTNSLTGIEVNVEATWLKLSQEHEQERVEAVVNIVQPQPSTYDIAKIGDVLGDYSTFFNPHEEQRTNNVRLAAMALNNRLIPPGGVFSFNEVVGERTAASGYSPAIVFVDRSMIRDIGGGICQDSSTLYQAVRQANLAIVERHTHSLPVSYVIRGQDATVSYGILDFRFQNDTQGYLLISAQTGTNWLRVRLFGLADNTHPKLQKPQGYPRGLESWEMDPK
ncbi:VanW family protein [Desulfosporosinus hippei]|uniref:VanW like protein n=1 Tax=Desulfosporosinus hippei DSM 8344 TaxID=1121419 RepID=A0A1G7XUH2_9FIRM|nr:VanW family protein [Desulfosporosinus hippei]SDG87819.1 VanW like protein [Desulfosporosinus hippei DSM 8344]